MEDGASAQLAGSPAIMLAHKGDHDAGQSSKGKRGKHAPQPTVPKERDRSTAREDRAKASKDRRLLRVEAAMVLAMKLVELHRTYWELTPSKRKVNKRVVVFMTKKEEMVLSTFIQEGLVFLGRENRSDLILSFLSSRPSQIESLIRKLSRSHPHGSKAERRPKEITKRNRGRLCNKAVSELASAIPVLAARTFRAAMRLGLIEWSEVSALLNPNGAKSRRKQGPPSEPEEFAVPKWYLEWLEASEWDGNDGVSDDNSDGERDEVVGEEVGEDPKVFFRPVS